MCSQVLPHEHAENICSWIRLVVVVMKMRSRFILLLQTDRTEEMQNTPTQLFMVLKASHENVDTLTSNMAFRLSFTVG